MPDLATANTAERANPHPSGDPTYVVEAIERYDGMVRVRYVVGGPSWWITDDGWADWVRLSPSVPVAAKADA